MANEPYRWYSVEELQKEAAQCGKAEVLNDYYFSLKREFRDLSLRRHVERICAAVCVITLCVTLFFTL